MDVSLLDNGWTFLYLTMGGRILLDTSWAFYFFFLTAGGHLSTCGSWFQSIQVIFYHDCRLDSSGVWAGETNG